MPCYYTGSAEGDANLAAKEARDALTEVTALLCSMCSAYENNQGVPAAVAKWWSQHKKMDRETRMRTSLEANRRFLRQKALKKLSKAEREALGL